MEDRPHSRRGRPPSGGREAILQATLALARSLGIARVTTREVARAAGVSEASIFYHFGDRAGLLTAAFQSGVGPLEELGRSGLAGEDRRHVLASLGSTLERFLEEVLPVIAAAQSDTELHRALAAHMAERNLGPHRGVEALAEYLAGEQRAGRVRGDVDPAATALAFIGSCTVRVLHRQLSAGRGSLPGLEATIDAFDTLLSPPVSCSASADAQRG
jgi:AcrR family transcriptional regulator